MGIDTIAWNIMNKDLQIKLNNNDFKILVIGDKEPLNNDIQLNEDKHTFFLDEHY